MQDLYTSPHKNTVKFMACEKYSDYELYVDLILDFLQTQLCKKRINFAHFSEEMIFTSVAATLFVNLKMIFIGNLQLQTPLSTFYFQN